MMNFVKIKTAVFFSLLIAAGYSLAAEVPHQPWMVIDGTTARLTDAASPGRAGLSEVSVSHPIKRSLYSISSDIWKDNRWGKQFLVGAFGLEDFNPEQARVYTKAIPEFKSGSALLYSITHYVYDEQKEKYCTIEFKSRKQNNYHSIYVTLMGCQQVFNPKT